jgi:putative ABC transport system permease protein
MFDRDRWTEIWYALKQNKFRTILTGIGVLWGILMLVVMLGCGKGLENGVFDGMGGFATNSAFIWPQQTNIPYKGFKKGRRYNFTNSDTKILKTQIPELETLAPRIIPRFWRSTNNSVVRGLKSGTFNIVGDYPDFNKIDPVTFLQGRYINEDDIKYKRKVVVIGRKVKEALFLPEENAIGDYIKIKGVYFLVVGVFKSQHKGQQADNQDSEISLPLTTLQQTYNYGDAIDYYGLTVRPDVTVSVVEGKVKEILRRRHTIAPDDKEAVGSANVEEEFKKIKILFLGINVLVWIVGIGTLIAGVIGVSNIMLIIVKERTKEIGIQRAIGARPVTIISQIISEAVFLTTIAGYFGLLIGVAFIEALNFILKKASAGNADGNAMFTRPEVNFKLAISALIILIICGALAGLIPAKRAVSIKPIDALRYE